MLQGAWALTIALTLQAPPAAAPAPSPAETSAPAEFFKALGRDVKEFGTRDSLAIAAVGGLSALLLHPADDNLADWAETAGHTSYTDIGSVLGNGWLQGSAAFGTYLGGVVAHHEHARALGSDLIRGQILNGLITRVLKVTVQRERPDGGSHAFPSGHASATFTTAAVLERHFGWSVGVPAYGVATFVGWTRVRDSQHWLSDVVAGATIGIIVGRAAGALAPGRHWAVVPALGSERVALYVVH